MSIPLEHIILTDDWSAERMESIRAALRDDPDLEASVRRWIALSSAVGDELRRDLPPAEALVQYALRDTGHVDVASGEERRLLQDVNTRMESAIENHPAVRHILDRIREDADDFERCWNEAASRPAVSAQPVIERHMRPVQSGPSDRDPAPSRSRLRLVSPRWMAAAAAIVLLAVSTMLLLGPETTADSERITLTADAGAYLPVELPDGTDLRLAGPATLSYDEAEPRSVDLTGSAFFDVRPGDTQFAISTSTATIEVLGTSFGVLSDDASTEVTLVTGSLRLVSPDGRAVQLAPGQRSRVSRAGGPIAPDHVNLTDVLRWTGLFVFRDTPLTDVARILGEEYDIRIHISGELRDETLTGTFAQEQGVVEILRVISAAIKADLDISDDHSIFKLRR